MSRLIVAALVVGALASAAAQQTLKYVVPEGWTSQPPSSGMRQAQFVLPREQGDPEDATAVVFFFGKGEGGGVDENLDRWAGQMYQADGTPGTRKQAKTGSATVNGLKVTTLDIAGTYTGGMGSGGQLGPKARSRMKAAVVETPGGNYFIRVLGPQRTVTKWEPAIDQFFKSMKY